MPGRERRNWQRKEGKGMGVGLRIGERGSPGARLGALGQKTVDKKTDLFGEGAENGSVGAKGLGKKTDLFVSREGTREQGSLEEFAAAPGHEGADNETDLLGRALRGTKGLGKKTDLFGSREGTREQGSLGELAAAPGHEGADNETDLLGRDVCVVLGPLGGGIRGGRGRRRPW